MKKMIFSFVAVLAMTIALVSWKSSKVTSAAVVISDFGCGFLDGDGHAAIADKSHSVVTSSGKGNMKCSASVPNTAHKTVKYDFESTGSGCLSADLSTITDDWSEVVSASGQATLSCKFR